MATIVADMSVSLDGFVAEPDGGVERVFAWYGKPQPESQPKQGAVGARRERIAGDRRGTQDV